MSAPSIEFVLVGIVWAWVAWPFLTPGKFVYGFDTLSYSGPATKTSFEAWKNLRIPLWSEHMFGGVPFLGRISAQALYFPNLLFSFFQLNTAMDLIMAAHLLLLGFGVLVLIRFGLKLSAPAGSIAAITILTSAFVGVKTLSFDQLTAIAWLPWILFFLEKMITSERPYKYFSGLSLSVTALVFGGHPQFVYHFLGLSSLFAVSRLLDQRAWKSLTPLFTCAVATVVPPVPPEVIGNAEPERVTANVPLVVIGEPVIVKKVGTDNATEVTVPEEVPFDTAVTSPLALTVTLALVNEPTLELTVAKVPAAVTLAEPLKVGLV